MSKYELTVTNTGYGVSLSRTGGQGAKGDSISNIYIDNNNDLLVDISNSAGEVIKTENLGSIDTIVQDASVAAIEGSVAAGNNYLITVTKNESGTFDFSVVAHVDGSVPDSLVLRDDKAYVHANAIALDTDNVEFHDDVKEGQIGWSRERSAIIMGLDDQGKHTYVNQQQVAVVYNPYEDIPQGKVVYIEGSYIGDAENFPTVNLASNDLEDTSTAVLGVAMYDIPGAFGGKGYVCTHGIVEYLDTSGLTAGDKVWLGVDGNVVSTEPLTPAARTLIGYVVKADAVEGSIFVQKQAGLELYELDDVSITNPQDGDFIAWNSSNGHWENVNLNLTFATDEELQLLNSSIQAQLAGKSNTTHTHTLNDLSDVNILAKTTSYVITYDAVTQKWISRKLAVADITGLQSALDGKAATSHFHTKSQITDFRDSDYATAAQGLLANTAIQPNDNVSELVNDAGYITGYTVTEADVTQHQAALSVTESQISDLQNYALDNHVHSINDLTDAGLGTLATNDLLAWDGLKWVNASADSLNILETTDIGVSVQGYTASLDSIANVTVTADKVLYTTGVDTWASMTVTPFARTLLNDIDAATMRATIGAEPADATILKDADIGVNVQAYNAFLDDVNATFTSDLKAKIDGIEANATADQTGPEIKGLYEAQPDTNAYTDAEKSKLAGIEDNAKDDQIASEVPYTNTTSGLTATDVQAAIDEVEGRVDTAEAKLSGIEAGATADQTGAEIKSLYEAEADTNAFTDAEKSKLAGIEAGAQVNTVDSVNGHTGTVVLETDDISDALQTNKWFTTTERNKLSFIEDYADVTDNVNVEASGAVMYYNTDVSTAQWVLDEDGLTSNSATKVPTQQSVKAYVDNRVASSVDYQGGYDASTNVPDLDVTPSGVSKGDMYTVTVAGTFFTIAVEVGDVLIAEVDNATTEAQWTIVNKNLDAASIKTSYESNADTNAFTDSEKSKLAGIEAGATADQTGAEIKSLYEAEADTNAFTDALKAKLDGIEAGATGDQTAAEILTAIKTVDGAASGLDADLLDGQQGSYYLDYNNATNKPTSIGQLTTARDITLSGVVTGTASFDGTADANITVTSNMSLDNLTNVTETGKATNDYLRWTGTTWEGDHVRANDVTYNNADSALESTTVKSALDELSANKVNVTALNSTLTVYPTTVSSTIGGYYRGVTSTTDTDYNTTAVDVSTGEINTTAQLIAAVATDEGVLNGDTGVVVTSTIANVRRTAGTGTATFYYEVYHRTTGGVETLIATSSETDPVDTATYTHYSATAILGGGTTFTSTDRLVVKWFANQKTTSNPTYQIQFGGSDPARTIVPVPISTLATVSSAASVSVDTSNFTGYLAGTDATVQAALEQLDGISGSSADVASTLVERDANNKFGITGVDFTQTHTLPNAVGRLKWNNTDGTLDLGLKGGNAILQIGQEQVIRVYNGTGASIANGKALAITGATGAIPSVVLADADIESHGHTTVGVATETIANGASGYMTIQGLVRGVNTSAWAEGSELFLSTTAGTLTTTKPTTVHVIHMGVVIVSDAVNGSILVQPKQPLYDDLWRMEDVTIGTQANGDILVWNSTAGVWENKAQSVLSITESQISDLKSYSLDTHNHTLDSLSNTTISANTAGEILKWNGSAWVNNTLAEAGIQPAGSYSLTGHVHAASDITSGTFANARIAESNVTQHQAALSITESQISDFGSYAASNHTHAINDLTDVTITSVTAEQFLKWDGAKWVNADIPQINALNDIGDVNITTVADKEIISYDNVTSKWVNSVNSLANLADTTVTSPANGHVVVYNQTSSTFENKDVSVTLTGDVTGTGTMNANGDIAISTTTVYPNFTISGTTLIINNA